MPLPKEQFLPSSAKAELVGRERDLKAGGIPELLRKAGKEMYDNPVVNTAISLSPGAGDLQSGLEALASAREGDWTGAALNGIGVLPFVPALRTVWHGSPHTFDKFDLSKIGTGEGAQAYGHGLYFAEAPGVAKQYRDELSRGWKQSYEYKGKPVEKLYEDAVNKGNYGDAMLWEQVQLHGTKDSVRNTLLEEVAGGSNQAKQALKTLETLPDNLFAQPTGSLYKVDLPDEQIAKMLDWDKPLSQQAPEIQSAIKNSPYAEELSKNDAWYGKEPTADQLYFRLSDLTSPKEASEYFASKGIPGIQYLDQASRGAGEGTRNYVVFDDQIPKILERNGNPLVEALRNSK